MNAFYFIEAEITEEYVRKVCTNALDGKLNF